MQRIAALFALAVFSVCLSGCGSSPEQQMIGKWELDKEATNDINPLLAAVPGGMEFEFKSGGAGTGKIAGESNEMKWKVVKNDGAKLTLEIDDGKDKNTVEITVADADHLLLNFPQGMGACKLKRMK